MLLDTPLAEAVVAPLCHLSSRLFPGFLAAPASPLTCLAFNKPDCESKTLTPPILHPPWTTLLPFLAPFPSHWVSYASWMTLDNSQCPHVEMRSWFLPHRVWWGPNGIVLWGLYSHSALPNRKSVSSSSPSMLIHFSFNHCPIPVHTPPLNKGGVHS